ncbi:MAG: hypothetical protein NVSMB21_22440 [Vulcanimicrobiaceae bacterium]
MSRLKIRSTLLAIAMCVAIASVASAEVLADGSIAQIARGANGYPCTATAAKYDDLDRALAMHRKYAKLRAMQGGLFLDLGERVRVVGHAGSAPTILHLRVESGTDAGKSCWIASDVDDSFANVRPAREAPRRRARASAGSPPIRR